MNVSVLFFAALKDEAKTSRLELDLPDGASVETALEKIVQDFPSLGKWLPHARVALNMEYVQNSQILRDGDELALIPPVAGGDNAPYVRVVERELELDEVVRAVQVELGTCIGAICTFSGVVRDHSTDLEGTDHNDIEFLDYEAYTPMAERELEKIAREAREKWGASVAVCHRIGRLHLGEASVAIAAATPHRGESFEACRYVIEQLKIRVPIWKKETARSGFWWSEGQNSSQNQTQNGSQTPNRASENGL